MTSRAGTYWDNRYLLFPTITLLYPLHVVCSNYAVCMSAAISFYQAATISACKDRALAHPFIIPFIYLLIAQQSRKEERYVHTFNYHQNNCIASLRLKQHLILLSFHQKESYCLSINVGEWSALSSPAPPTQAKSRCNVWSDLDGMQRRVVGEDLKFQRVRVSAKNVAGEVFAEGSASLRAVGVGYSRDVGVIVKMRYLVLRSL